MDNKSNSIGNQDDEKKTSISTIDLKYLQDMLSLDTTDYYTTLYPSPGIFNQPVYNPQIVNSGPTWNHNSYTWNIPLTSSASPKYHVSPRVTTLDSSVEVNMEDGSLEHITREELLKYISERKAIQENELVRTMYERYQVALKLSRSDDDGDAGV